MQISSISNKMPAFRAQKLQAKPLIQLEGKKDDEIVTYGTWGPNYVYPITAGQLRKQIAEQISQEENQKTNQEIIQETPDEYYNRKINSPEWGAY